MVLVLLRLLLNVGFLVLEFIQLTLHQPDFLLQHLNLVLNSFLLYVLQFNDLFLLLDFQVQLDNFLVSSPAIRLLDLGQLLLEVILLVLLLGFRFVLLDRFLGERLFFCFFDDLLD